MLIRKPVTRHAGSVKLRVGCKKILKIIFNQEETKTSWQDNQCKPYHAIIPPFHLKSSKTMMRTQISPNQLTASVFLREIRSDLATMRSENVTLVDFPIGARVYNCFENGKRNSILHYVRIMCFSPLTIPSAQTITAADIGILYTVLAFDIVFAVHAYYN